MKTKKEGIELRAYNLKELATLYSVNQRTIKTWLVPHQNAIGPRQGRFYLIPQVEVIFNVLGIPGVLDEDEF